MVTWPPAGFAPAGVPRCVWESSEASQLLLHPHFVPAVAQYAYFIYFTFREGSFLNNRNDYKQEKKKVILYNATAQRDLFCFLRLCISFGRRGTAGPASLLRFPLQTSFDCFCLCKNLRVSSILNGTIIHKLWGEMVTSQLGLLRCEYRTALRYSSLFHFMFN